MSSKKTYEAPRVVAREDLKQITLYTGLGGNNSYLGPAGSRGLHWTLP